MKHLNESILSKTTGQYRSKVFPLNPPTRDELVKWLEDNGYELIVPPLPDTAYWPSKVLKEARKKMQKVYSLGLYYYKVPLSHFVIFSDGNMAFQVYTDKGLDREPRYCVYDDAELGPTECYISFEEFRKSVVKHLKTK